MKLKKPIAKLGRKERNIGKAAAGTAKPKVKKQLSQKRKYDKTNTKNNRHLF